VKHISALQDDFKQCECRQRTVRSLTYTYTSMNSFSYECRTQAVVVTMTTHAQLNVIFSLLCTNRVRCCTIVSNVPLEEQEKERMPDYIRWNSTARHIVVIYVAQRFEHCVR
jgi:hypothetical protein